MVLLSWFLSGAAHAGNVTTGSAWPYRIVSVVICESTDMSKKATDAERAKLMARGCALSGKNGNDELIEPEAAKLVRDMIKEWNKHLTSNVALLEVDTAPPSAYIRVMNDSGGCSSDNSGYKWYWRRHDMFVDNACIGKSSYIIIHEFMHRLGVEHEHQRDDREKYLSTEFFTEIDPTLHEQYEIDGRKVGDYDFLSVMHYSLNPVGGKSKPTKEGDALLKKLGVTATTKPSAGGVGQRLRLSDGDKASIADLYPAMTP